VRVYIGFGEPLACWPVNVEDLFRGAMLVIECVGEDGFFSDWDGRPGRSVNHHSLDSGWTGGEGDLVGLL
jgi:hypothetical protein